MPTGGQIAGGTGLSLQPTTPGVAEKGNAHLTGAMLVEGTLGAAGGMVTAGGVRQRVAIVGEGVSIPFPQQTMAASGPVALGSDAILGQAGRGWTSQIESVAIGNGAKAAGRGDTVIGWGASCDYLTATPDPQFTVLIGRSASFTASSVNGKGCSVVIGSNVNAGNCDYLVAIGHDINVGQKGHTATKKSSVILGAGVESSAGTNQIIISTEYAGAVLADEIRGDLIKIGDKSHSRIEIGGLDFTLSGQVKFISTAIKTVENSAAETSIVGTGVGSNTIPDEAWRIGKTIEISGRGAIQATGTPTVTIRVKVGGTTIITIGPTALPVLPAGYHGWELKANATAIEAPNAAMDILCNGGISIAGQTVNLSSALVAAVAIDATVDNLVDVTIQWGAADPLNSIKTTNYEMEAIG